MEHSWGISLRMFIDGFIGRSDLIEKAAIRLSYDGIIYDTSACDRDLAYLYEI